VFPIYRREKLDTGWKHIHVNLGPGRRPADAPPYYVRYTVAGKRKWSDAFPTLQKAIDASEALPLQLEAEAKQIPVAEVKTLQDGQRMPLRYAVAQFLERMSNTKRPHTVANFRITLTQFCEAMDDIRYLDQINVDTLRRYKEWMEAKPLAERTVFNRLVYVDIFLKKFKVQARLPKDERPTIEFESAQPFEKKELEKLFAVMDDENKLLFKFFLCRKQEVQFATWRDLNLEKGTFDISSKGKDDVGFKVKNHENRTVPLPDSLVKALKARQAGPHHPRWIFTNPSGFPDDHLLLRLKRFALKAGLNCGNCKREARGKAVTCATHPVCDHIYLHRLRKTCATAWSDAQIPVRDIQEWLGHKSLETTMIYLGVANPAKHRDKINAAFGD